MHRFSILGLALVAALAGGCVDASPVTLDGAFGSGDDAALGDAVNDADVGPDTTEPQDVGDAQGVRRGGPGRVRRR